MHISSILIEVPYLVCRKVWASVEAGVLMSGASYIMERFQRNWGARPGSLLDTSTVPTRT